MKWTLVSAPSSAVHVFNLSEANTVTQVLRYNPLQKSARLSGMGPQRLFFIEEAGFRNHHLILKNEYGFTIGRLSAENHTNEAGLMEIEEKKFSYQLTNRPVPELTIYELDQVQPLLTCAFVKNAGREYLISPTASLQEFASLLLGLCWYVLNPTITENRSVYQPALALV